MAPDDGSAGRRLALLVATATYADPGLAALSAPTAAGENRLGELLMDSPARVRSRADDLVVDDAHGSTAP